MVEVPLLAIKKLNDHALDSLCHNIFYEHIGNLIEIVTL